MKILEKKIILTIIFIFVLLVILSYYLKQSLFLHYDYSTYEKELINHFKEIALKTEYGDNKDRIVKWQKPMYLCPLLNGESIKLGQCKEQLESVKKIVNSINNIINSEFKIILTDDIKKCNAIIYFTSIEKMNKMYPNFFKGIEENVAGLTKGYWYKYSLYKIEIFIDINQSLETQKSAITEEISQSIGLSNDTKKHPNSIFYQNKLNDGIFTTDLSLLDKDIIQILYNPNVKVGMKMEQVEKELIKILKNKELKLYGQNEKR